MLLNRHNFAVADFAPKEDSRYDINGIQVSSAGTVATNGHYLVRVTLPKMDGRDFPPIEGFTQTSTVNPFILPTAAAKKIQAAMPKNEQIPVLNHACVGDPSETTANIVVTDLETTQVFKPRPITRQFPQWENVIPKDDASLEICLNGAYLAQMAKAATTFTDSPSEAVLLRFRGADKPVEIETLNSETGQKWYGLLMPMRGGEMRQAIERIDKPEPEPEPIEVQP